MSKSIESKRYMLLSMVNEYGLLDFRQIRDALPNVSDVVLRKDLHVNDGFGFVRGSTMIMP